jgi:hypothetical protein
MRDAIERQWLNPGPGSGPWMLSHFLRRNGKIMIMIMTSQIGKIKTLKQNRSYRMCHGSILSKRDDYF